MNGQKSLHTHGLPMRGGVELSSERYNGTKHISGSEENTDSM